MAQLCVAQMISDTTAEGPGRRFGLWLQGCPLRCQGCCNPEMWPPDGGELYEVAELVETIRAQEQIEGLTLLGGEPFAQAAAAAELCRPLRDRGLSIVIFTGYTLEELERRAAPPELELVSLCDLLIDGPYLPNHRETRRRWVGSSNQSFHFLTDRYRDDDERLAQANSVELRLVDGVLTVNGWPAMELDQ